MEVRAMYFISRIYVILTLQVILTLILPPDSLSQGVNIGVPPVHNYSRKVYGAATQNWDISQDMEGRLYFANNDGLVCFDGTNWNVYPIANHTIVRSVAITGSGRIFVGGQSEFGYFAPSSNGNLVYHSLVHLLKPQDRSFEDVWDIVFSNGAVFFRTNRTIFVYKNKTIESFHPEHEIISLFMLGKELQVQLSDYSILTFDGSRFSLSPVRIRPGSVISGAIIWSADTTLLTTLKDGIYYVTPRSGGEWVTPKNSFLKENRIYSACRLQNGHLALGTSLTGMVILDRQRRVYRHLTRKHGLQNNNVLSTYCDRDGNLWLGLDNGIDCIVPQSPFTTIFPDDELQATGYHAAVFEHHLYLGVSNGAYIAPWKNYYDPEEQPLFRRVDNAEGQVWSMTQIDQNLLLGHHEGAFIISGNKANQINTEQGSWTYIRIDDNTILAGTYSGLTVYKKTDGAWLPAGKIKGLAESCRIMVRDESGEIWISHPYRGLYKLTWNEKDPFHSVIRFYDSKDGLPTHLNNYVWLISGKAVFGTEKGVYKYNAVSDRFTPDDTYRDLISPDQRVRYMREDAKGNIWFVTNREVGILLVEEFGIRKEVRKKVFPDLAEKLVGGFEFIYPIDETNVLFGAEEGFIHYDAEALIQTDSTLPLHFTSIQAFGKTDTILFGGYGYSPSQTDDQRTSSGGYANTLDAGYHQLTFAYSTAIYHTPHLVQYRTKLEGLEDAWTAWSQETRRIFTNLNPGRYTLHVETRIRDSDLTDAIHFRFRIRPPWYKTNTAFACYSLGVMGLFLGFMTRQRKQFETEKARITDTIQQKEEQHKREVEESKAALSDIQNEKLEVEIKYKNQELAMTTMHLVQKAEILLTVQEGLNQIQEKNIDPSVKKEVRQLLNLLNFDVKLDEDWEHFAHHFDQVHVDFLKNLRDTYPQLSASDLKLCAYLRMNLSTKEIAPLLNISVRGVEGSRYRLRKKLLLPNDANLTDFILGISADKP